MATKFKDFIREIEKEAKAEGPEAERQLKDLRAHFRLGRELAQARKQLRLTQQELARRTNIDQAEVSRIEHGVGNPTFSTLNAVASGVGLRLAFAKTRRRSA